MARFINGVLDLRTEETPPLIKYTLVKGDTFRRVITVTRPDTDYSNATATVVIKDAKPPAGNIVYSDVTVPMYEVIVPVAEGDVGSAKFTIDIPATATSNFPTRKILYGKVRIVMEDGYAETLYTLEITLVQE